MMDGMSGFMSNFGFSGGPFGWLIMILVWGVIIFAIIVLIKWLFDASTKSGGSSGKSALDILEERYARGEIDREEYEQKKRDLG